MERIAIIPARSGSKGLKDKNIRELNGKPLVAYSVECALKSGKYNKVFVSTDSGKYADIAISYGADCSFLRTPETSTDGASTWDAVREVIREFEKRGIFYDEISLLQATSPLRDVSDIVNCIEFFYAMGAEAVETVTEMEHSPLQANVLPEDRCMDNFFHKKYSHLSRQELPKYYRENGAIYHFKRCMLEKEDSEMFRKGCYAYIMPAERSIDIDTELDFMVAELYMKKRDASDYMIRWEKDEGTDE